MGKEKEIQTETKPQALGDKLKAVFAQAKDKAAELKAKVLKKQEKVETSEAGMKNALSKVFQKVKQEEGQENLVSNILEQKGKVQEEDKLEDVNKVLERQTKEQLFWSRVTSAVALGVLFVSLLVNWIALSEGNVVLGLIGVNNYTVAENNLQAEQKKTTQKYNEIKNKYDALLSQDSSTDAVMLAEILAGKIYWTDEMQLINKVVTRISPYNPVTKKVAISQYTFDTENQKITVAGYLQNESEDRIYSLIANAVDAFKESPYFTGVSLSQFSASEQDLGNYASPLRLTFYVQDGDNVEDNKNFLATDYSKRRYRHSGYQMDGTLTEVVYEDTTTEPNITMHAAPNVIEEEATEEAVVVTDETEADEVGVEEVGAVETTNVLEDSFGLSSAEDEVVSE